MTHSQNASTHDIAELIDRGAARLVYQARVKAWGMRGRCLAAMAGGGAGATWRHAYQVEPWEAGCGRAGGLGGLVRGVRGA